MASSSWCKCLWKQDCDYTVTTVTLFQVHVKSSMYCDTSALLLSIVYKTATIKIINVLRHSRLVFVDCLLNRRYKKITWILMIEIPVKTTLRLCCDDSHLVSSVWNHQCIATQFWSIVHKTATVKTIWIWRKNGSTSSATKFFFQCVNYMCKGVTKGQSRPIDLNSSFIFSFILSLSLCLWF